MNDNDSIKKTLEFLHTSRQVEELKLPCFVYDLTGIQKRIDEIRELFGKISFKQYYPVKANPCPEIIKLCLENNIGLDACSLGDLIIADLLNVESKNISYTGVALSEKDMQLLFRKNIIPNLCSLEQVKKWASLFPDSCIGIRVSTRIPGANSQGQYSLKMGIFYEEWPELQKIVLNHNLKIIKLHRHESKNSIFHEELLKDFSSTFDSIPEWVWENVNTINFGGGWGLSYSRTGKLNLEKLISGIIGIAKKMENSTTSNPLIIEIEPGEYLIGESGFLLTSVVDVRHTITPITRKKLQVVILDSPFPTTSGSRDQELSNHIQFSPEESNEQVEKILTIVYGRSNSSMDTINKGMRASEVKIGDWALVSEVGAYVPILLSHFNELDIPIEYIMKDTMIKKTGKGIKFESHFKQIYLPGEENE